MEMVIEMEVLSCVAGATTAWGGRVLRRGGRCEGWGLIVCDVMARAMGSR